MISELPDNLIITLNRFEFDKLLKKRVKRMDAIDIPATITAPSNNNPDKTI